MVEVRSRFLASSLQVCGSLIGTGTGHSGSNSVCLTVSFNKCYNTHIRLNTAPACHSDKGYRKKNREKSPLFQAIQPSLRQWRNICKDKM